MNVPYIDVSEDDIATIDRIIPIFQDCFNRWPLPTLAPGYRTLLLDFVLAQVLTRGKNIPPINVYNVDTYPIYNVSVRYIDPDTGAQESDVITLNPSATTTVIDEDLLKLPDDVRFVEWLGTTRTKEVEKVDGEYPSVVPAELPDGQIRADHVRCEKILRMILYRLDGIVCNRTRLRELVKSWKHFYGAAEFSILSMFECTNDYQSI